MLFARWQYHLRFYSGFHYAPLKAMVTKISKWSRIQDSFTPKIESLVVCAIPDIPSKFQKNPSITFWVILLIHRQTDKVWQKHSLLGRGNKLLRSQYNEIVQRKFVAVWVRFAGIWDKIQQLYYSHAEVHILIVPWRHLVNDTDLCRSPKSPKIHKTPILAFKVIQDHWIWRQSRASIRRSY